MMEGRYIGARSPFRRDAVMLLSRVTMQDVVVNALAN